MSLVATAGCGRTPVWQPCDGVVEYDVPALSCEHPTCATANSARIQIGADNALIVQDRSCSMAELIDGRNKWSRAVEAVTSAVASSRRVRWGLSLFPDGDADGVLRPIVVPVADGQADTIVALLTAALDRDDPNHPHQPGEPCFTNLDDAISQAADRRVFADLDGSSQIILITDGFAAYTRAAEEIANLHNRGVSTFVVGFGGAVRDEALQTLAEAGGVPASGDTAYYRAGLDDLGAALTEVIEGLRCSQRLILPTDEIDRLQVHWSDGTFVPADPSGVNGWRYDLQTETIMFAGDSCVQLLTGNVDAIDLDLDCG